MVLRLWVEGASAGIEPDDLITYLISALAALKSCQMGNKTYLSIEYS
jgi:hypothetical protein